VVHGEVVGLKNGELVMGGTLEEDIKIKCRNHVHVSQLRGTELA